MSWTPGDNARQAVFVTRGYPEGTYMAAKLTSLAVRNANPKRRKGELRRTEIPDAGSGLYLIVQPSGAKSWAVRYRFADAPRKLTLGTAIVLDEGEKEPVPVIGGALTLAGARKLAAVELHALAQGVDPAAAKRQAAAASEQAAFDRARDTVEHLAEQFIEKHAKKKTRSWKGTQRIFEKDILPAWRGRTIHDVKRRDVIQLLEDIAEDRPALAIRARAILSKFFNWLAGREVIAASPCVGVEQPAAQTARTRTLSDAEIVTLWKAADAIGPFGSYVKLLVLTGQRRTEVAGMRWSEIDEAECLWTLPAERSKNKLAHAIPLSSQAWDIIGAMPRIAGSDFVFAGARNSYLQSFTRTKAALDAKMRPAKPWVFHDLRRSAATGMQRLGVPIPVIERALNHKSGAFRGIVSVYQTHDYRS